MTNETQILSVLADVHLAIGRLEGTNHAILDEQETQTQRMTQIERRLGRLETRQEIDEHDAAQASTAATARRKHRASVIQGVWLTVAAVIGAGAGGILHAVGIG